MNKYHITGSFVAGIIFLAFVYQIYVNYQFQKAYTQDHQTLVSIVGFLNSTTKTK